MFTVWAGSLARVAPAQTTHHSATIDPIRLTMHKTGGSPRAGWKCRQKNHSSLTTKSPPPAKTRTDRASLLLSGYLSIWRRARESSDRSASLLRVIAAQSVNVGGSLYGSPTESSIPPDRALD